ncbi:sodium transporter [Thiosulfatimonas sediminis]|uniref:Sodium transporter n=1 Tax=Thiosulfatimonas sediminis TaxID=2675054 RepID=A0A6F8PVE8_9GAMM|nr:bile acid:sodium symporter family protein [Thiosulfatimonas sediminis]BBP46122.1 sodium transporter [Thiosulfatimonas sediminis]
MQSVNFFLFPLLAISGALLGLVAADWLVSLKSWIVPLLMLIMFFMGLTLSWRDFKQAWLLRKLVFWAVVLQFVWMPLLAFVLAFTFQLPQEWLIGMILVGATAGGTASNVMTYLAGGSVALSVSMTLFSTLLAVLLMPWITWLYLQNSIDIPALGMLLSLLKIVLVPIVLGMLLRHFASQSVTLFSPVLPYFAILAIALIIAIVVALNQTNLSALSLLLVLAVILHNLGGLAAGYALSRWLGYDSVVARTVAIEVAMQNSGLSVALALKYFSAASALPGALFSLWHNLSGILFAAYWQRKDK